MNSIGHSRAVKRFSAAAFLARLAFDPKHQRIETQEIESAYCNGEGIGTIADTRRSLGDVLTNSWFI